MDVQQTRQVSSEGTTVMVFAVALLAIGMVMVGTSSAEPQQALFSAAMWKSTFGRQIVFGAAGLVVLWMSARLWTPLVLGASEAQRKTVVVGLFVITIIGLVAVLVPSLSSERRGSHRWLHVGPSWLGLGVQPSELAKVTLVLFLAWLLTREQADPRSLLRGLLPAVMALGLCVALIGSENLGTAAMLSAAGMLMLVVAGCRWRYLILMAAVGVAGLVALLLAEDYRIARVKAFLDPLSDAQDGGYQPMQSLTTIASGGWLGSGLGSGIRKYYLPESSTDFIFSVICEEAGLLGGFLVITIYLGLIWLGVRTMLAATTRFERLAAFGITAVVGIQALMNVAVVTVSAPTTGVPLPLISAGGSGTLIWCAALGLLAAIGHHNSCKLQVASCK